MRLIEVSFFTNRGNSKHCLKDWSIFQVVSTRVQNSLMKCLTDVGLHSIKREINEAAFVSIVMDEITDLANFSQLAMIVRDVKFNGASEERLLDISGDRI